MRVTLLGTGGSAGVPMIGGADGGGEWGVCDPHEMRNVRTRSSIALDGGSGVVLVDTPPDMRNQWSLRTPTGMVYQFHSETGRFEVFVPQTSAPARSATVLPLECLCPRAFQGKGACSFRDVCCKSISQYATGGGSREHEHARSLCELHPRVERLESCEISDSF